uniref:Uncharacterized protein n=1 Tax=Globodera rostochiensis TaxID=31243 RepID=A0A914GTN7_GLORO
MSWVVDELGVDELGIDELGVDEMDDNSQHFIWWHDFANGLFVNDFSSLNYSSTTFRQWTIRQRLFVNGLFVDDISSMDYSSTTFRQ